MHIDDLIYIYTYMVIDYSMLVAILPCYNQYQVPYCTWYSNPALGRLP